ncbi:MAG: ATP-binding protein [Hyphomicrobiales bacterium]
MINTINVSNEEAKKLIAQSESHFYDRKSLRITPASVTKSISSFANADGGELIIGIEDGGDWIGFSNEEAANSIIDTLERNYNIGEFLNAIFISNESQSGLLLKLEVRKTPEVWKSADGAVYLRRSAQNLKLDAEGIKRLEYNKGIKTFENNKVEDSISSITNSAQIIEFMLGVVPNAEPEVWLNKQRLIRDGAPTVAGELLFADEPQIVLPKANVKIYRYKTSNQEGSRDTLAFDPISVEGPVCSLIASAVAKTIQITESIPVLGESGLEKIVYPVEAIHETITNAVLHRDYSSNDDVHVRIFDNRIEIQSPGRLPAHITVENILSERFARNPALVRFANKFPNAPNKDVGEGLNTTFEKMRGLKLKDPTIVERDGCVIVTLLHEKLASYEDIIVGYLNKFGRINNSKAREICREGSENKMKRIFEGMMASNLIRRVDGLKGKATAYELIDR